MILVDTNVLVDVLEDDSDWADWSIGQLRDLSQIHDLAINPIVYSELSLTFERVEDLDAVLAELEVKFLEIPHEALFLAAKAFLRYRRNGGRKGNVLADFFIGAHAAVAGCPILTRDSGRYRVYFPSVRLVMPASGAAE
ncbi:tRNA(fMet)-specific endonuclease VapC [bacterium BMS3Bbin12]|nr:tRNA(fMet)-specific endonuclease VapC [bacterium BMS3Bbin12]GBE49916.1 tRNA(fMet)-specific endonuclease VapC [bacterium BMS3Bbin13]